MSQGERRFVIFYFAYMLIYIACFALCVPFVPEGSIVFFVFIAIVALLHFTGMILGVCLFVVVIRDLREVEGVACSSWQAVEKAERVAGA